MAYLSKRLLYRIIGLWFGMLARSASGEMADKLFLMNGYFLLSVSNLNSQPTLGGGCKNLIALQTNRCGWEIYFLLWKKGLSNQTIISTCGRWLTGCGYTFSHLIQIILSILFQFDQIIYFWTDYTKGNWLSMGKYAQHIWPKDYTKSQE